jgi:hypothetical protein
MVAAEALALLLLLLEVEVGNPRFWQAAGVVAVPAASTNPVSRTRIRAFTWSPAE